VHNGALSVENVSLTYGSGLGRTCGLDRVSLFFRSGRLTLVSGPSGSGKTTLLAVLGCLLNPDHGDVWVMGRRANGLSEADRTRLRLKHIGYVFQAFRLFHSLSALDNLRLACDIAGHGWRSAQATMSVLEAVGLAGKARLKPHELSGGEKQRLALARVLVNNVSIILADEPTASLDSGTGAVIAQLLLGIAEQQRTVVVVSHDVRLQEFCHRMVTLRDGRVVNDYEVRP
jgi:putative ABC transport system ATP-binding protein